MQLFVVAVLLLVGAPLAILLVARAASRLFPGRDRSH